MYLHLLYVNIDMHVYIHQCMYANMNNIHIKDIDANKVSSKPSLIVVRRKKHDNFKDSVGSGLSQL